MNNTNEFEHQNVPINLKAESAFYLIAEFAADAAKRDERQCDTWGINDIVLPSKAFDIAFLYLMNNEYMKESRQKGELHFELMEVEDGDPIDAIILKGGYSNIQQAIYFYDVAPIKEIPAAEMAA